MLDKTTGCQNNTKSYTVKNSKLYTVRKYQNTVCCIIAVCNRLHFLRWEDDKSKLKNKIEMCVRWKRDSFVQGCEPVSFYLDWSGSDHILDPDLRIVRQSKNVFFVVLVVLCAYLVLRTHVWSFNNSTHNYCTFYSKPNFKKTKQSHVQYTERTLYSVWGTVTMLR